LPIRAPILWPGALRVDPRNPLMPVHSRSPKDPTFLTTHRNVTAQLEYKRDRVVCRDEPERSPKEKQLADELTAARASLKETTIANEALQSALDGRDAELAKAVAERLVALTQLNAVTTERRTLEVRLEAVEVQLAEALADRRRLLANLTDVETRHRQLSAEADRMQASQQTLLERKQALEVALEARQGELARAVAERSVVLCRLEEMATERHRAETLNPRDSRQEKLAAELEAAQLAAESGMRMVAEFGMERARLQQSIELMAGQHQDDLARRAEDEQRLHSLRAEALANREVVVSALAEHVRRLTPLVTTGRVARELAPQLRELLERVDGLASQVLDDCHLERQGRTDLETLRAEAVRAVALAGELMDATLDRVSQRVAID
jgi:chromosome segregation ATPase